VGQKQKSFAYLIKCNVYSIKKKKRASGKKMNPLVNVRNSSFKLNYVSLLTHTVTKN